MVLDLKFWFRSNTIHTDELIVSYPIFNLNAAPYTHSHIFDAHSDLAEKNNKKLRI